MAQKYFATSRDIQKRLQHGPTPFRDRSALKKNNDPNCLFLGTHKGLSGPLSFSFLGRNGDFRAIHATTTSFADLSQ